MDNNGNRKLNNRSAQNFKVKKNSMSGSEARRRMVKTDRSLSADIMVVDPVEKRRLIREKKDSEVTTTTVRRIKSQPDYVMLALVVVLTLFGLVMVLSASYAFSYISRGNSLSYFSSQAFYAVIGVILMVGAYFVFQKWNIKKLTPVIYLVTLGLLGLVLVAGIAAGEAQRWIVIGGFTLQPSEIAKLCVVITLAAYIDTVKDKIISSKFSTSLGFGIIFPGILLGLPCFLILLENHFSGVLITFAIGAVLIFVSGARKDVLTIIIIVAVVAVALVILVTPYARTRVDMYLHPDNYDPKGEIWQTLQGLNAIGSGGLFGVGLGNSKQKYLFVSQPQNDFIFSILCEELGFVGALAVITLFALLIWRGYRTALRAPDTFSSLVALGITSKLAIQTILNIAVVTNTIPNTGISLPFFSSGGTALIMQLIEMGVLLSISRYSYVESVKRNDDEVIDPGTEAVT